MIPETVVIVAVVFGLCFLFTTMALSQSSVRKEDVWYIWETTDLANTLWVIDIVILALGIIIAKIFESKILEKKEKVK